MPKQPIASVERPVANVSLLYVIAIVIFVVVLGLMAGAFIYERSLEQDITRLNQDLIDARNSFELSTIIELKRISARTTLANSLLNQHIALSKFFEALEKTTYTNASFSKLSIKTADSQATEISLNGMAGSYNTLILQSSLFKNVPFLTSPKFSDFSLDKNGNVGFSFSASVVPKLIDYKQYVNGE